MIWELISLRKPKTLEETYDECEAAGLFEYKMQVNVQQVRDMMLNAETSMRSAEILKQHIDRKDAAWMSIYLDYYTALQIFTEVFLALEKIKISNHKCLFAYLCIKHPELDFDWDFFEKIRTKRNGAHYYGEHITYEDWKSIEVQIKLYISVLKKEISNKGVKT